MCLLACRYAGLLLLCLAWAAGLTAPATGGRQITVALLSGRRNARFEAYLNGALSAELRDMGAARLVFRETGDYDRFMMTSEYRQCQLFKGSPVTYVIAARGGNYTPLLKSHYAGQSGYRAVIIVNRFSGITGLEDLIGKRLLFLNHHSASGFLYPRLFLLERGITEAMFAVPPFDVEHVKTHRDLVAAVNAGRWDAGCTFQDALTDYPAENINVLAVIPAEIPADLLFADSAFARAHPAFVTHFTRAYREWTNAHEAGHGYTLVPARDADYRGVRERWELYRRCAAAEQRLAAVDPARLKDIGAVRDLYRRAALLAGLRPGLYALCTVLGVAALLLLPRCSTALAVRLGWLRLRLRRSRRPTPAAAPLLFISHASADHPLVELIVDALESRGVRCWVAPRDVPPGTEYAAAIIAAIDRSRGMVVVLSAAANRSEHVKKEVGRAVDRRLPLLTVRTANVTPAQALEYFLADTQWLDAFPPPLAPHLQALGDAVQLRMGGAAEQFEDVVDARC